MRVPAPDVETGQVLVRVTLATICGSDLHTVSGRREAPTPCVLGHEGVGVIVDAAASCDASGDSLEPGDRVTWSLMATCGECAYCGPRGLPQKCDALSKYGHARYEGARDLNGCFADHILLKPGTRIYRLPDKVTDEEAVPLNCAGATIVGGLEAVRARRGESAVVLGAGMLGLYAAARLSDLGYETVSVVDRIDSRLRQATAFGATHTFQVGGDDDDAIGPALSELTDGRGPDLAVEVSGRRRLARRRRTLPYPRLRVPGLGRRLRRAEARNEVPDASRPAQLPTRGPGRCAGVRSRHPRALPLPRPRRSHIPAERPRQGLRARGAWRRDTRGRSARVSGSDRENASDTRRLRRGSRRGGARLVRRRALLPSFTPFGA